MRLAALLLVALLELVVATPPAAFGQTPPPTPVPPFGSPSPFPSVLRTPRPGARPPDLSAEAAALIDLDSGRFLLRRNAARRRSVASTTKIMTALVVLEAASPREQVTVSRNAAGQRGAELGLQPGERVRVRELLYAIMLQSANDAAVALAEHVAGDVDAFVAMMNQRARRLGLEGTRFRSPSGLDDAGFSTAQDMALITREAYRHALFARVASSRFRSIPSPVGPPRAIQNRNVLLWLYPGAIGTKTGWTAAAGFCLVAAAEQRGLRLAGVVLGAPREAFSDAAALLDHGFAGFERRPVVEEGLPLEPLVVDGERVPVGTGASLEALIGRGRDVVLTVRPDPGLSLPLDAGERVGAVVVRSAGEFLGRVPLVAVEPVGLEAEASPALAEDAPWWRPLLDPLAGLLGLLLRGVLQGIAS